LQSSGGYAESEQSYRRALEILRGLGDDRTPAYAAVLADLGELLMWRNRLDEAEAPIREALEIGRAVHGERHPEIVSSLVNLGRWRLGVRRYDEAGVHPPDAALWG